MNDYIVQHVQNEQERQDAYLIRNKVFVEEQKVPEELELDQFEAHSEHFVVYDLLGKPIGAGRLRPLSDTEAKVERICILQSGRGQGIGQSLMNDIEQIAKEKGIRKLFLHAQDLAENFYHRLGYTTVSSPFEEAGIIHVKMEKIL